MRSATGCRAVIHALRELWHSETRARTKDRVSVKSPLWRPQEPTSCRSVPSRFASKPYFRHNSIVVDARTVPHSTGVTDRVAMDVAKRPPAGLLIGSGSWSNEIRIFVTVYGRILIVFHFEFDAPMKRAHLALCNAVQKSGGQKSRTMRVQS